MYEIQTNKFLFSADNEAEANEEMEINDYEKIYRTEGYGYMSG